MKITRISLFCFFLVVIFLGGCESKSSTRSVSYSASNQANKNVTIGEASWYGRHFHGRKTASGIVFNKNLYSAAHRTLPFGSLIKVTNIENNKKIVLMVTDRGPVPKNRILDVSEQAAKKLGFLSKGTAKIRMQYLPKQTKILSSKSKDGSVAAMYVYFIKNRFSFS